VHFFSIRLSCLFSIVILRGFGKQGYQCQSKIGRSYEFNNHRREIDSARTDGKVSDLFKHRTNKKTTKKD
jgi:hypothetical protein